MPHVLHLYVSGLDPEMLARVASRADSPSTAGAVTRAMLRPCAMASMLPVCRCSHHDAAVILRNTQKRCFILCQLYGIRCHVTCIARHHALDVGNICISKPTPSVRNHKRSAGAPCWHRSCTGCSAVGCMHLDSTSHARDPRACSCRNVSGVQASIKLSSVNQQQTVTCTLAPRSQGGCTLHLAKRRIGDAGAGAVAGHLPPQCRWQIPEEVVVVVCCAGADIYPV